MSKIININLILAGTYTYDDWEEFANEVIITKGIYKYHKSTISRDIIQELNRRGRDK